MGCVFAQLVEKLPFSIFRIPIGDIGVQTANSFIFGFLKELVIASGALRHCEERSDEAISVSLVYHRHPACVL